MDGRTASFAVFLVCGACASGGSSEERASASRDPTPPPPDERTANAAPPQDAAIAESAAPPGDAASAPPPPRYGAIHVSGSKVVDATGAPVVLRGMSLFWSQWGGAFWNASVVETLSRDWGATIVRAAMGVEQGGYLTDPALQKSRVRTVVDAAIARGVYVIVDWHDHHADQHLEEAKSFFAEMTDSYGGSPNVLFEIWNEPEDIAWGTVKAYANTIVPLIRSHGGQNVVLVGTPHWGQDVDVASVDPLGDTNVAYTLHFYAASHKLPFRLRAQIAVGRGLPLFVSEWGTTEASGDGVIDTTESHAWLDFLKANDISWCNWSLFDKPESASALVPNSDTNGPWPPTALTVSGTFVKTELAKP
jgi:endoglucanase